MFQSLKESKNPFSISFGTMPNRYISRLLQSKGIIDSFENGGNDCYVIAGIRDYLLWKKGKKEVDVSLLGRYDQYFQEYVYDKIWTKPTSNEQAILKAFQGDGEERVEHLLQTTGFDKKKFSVYRDRLLKRGLLSAPAYGRLSLKLPRFHEFLMTK
ncbi:MAG: hypothetical protein J6A47_08305 [Bacilli bacterium]|nr:hypothetical protein [Bacilli bacterium]